MQALPPAEQKDHEEVGMIAVEKGAVEYINENMFFSPIHLAYVYFSHILWFPLAAS